jgi:hypothetical protein
LSSSFTLERHLTVFVDGELKASEVARIDYAGGKVTRTVASQEFAQGKKMEVDVQGDPAVKLEFACQRFESVADNHYRYRSEGGDEEILFELDLERRALKPLSWSATQTVKFLFLKKTLRLNGENYKFQWRQ